MNREFVETKGFLNSWYTLGLTDQDLISLQSYLLENPTAGDVIEGIGGLRKIR